MRYTSGELEHILTYHRRGITYFVSNGRGKFNKVIPLKPEMCVLCHHAIGDESSQKTTPSELPYRA